MIVKINVMKRYETLILVCRGHFLLLLKLRNVDLSMFLIFFYKKGLENGLDTPEFFQEFNPI